MNKPIRAALPFWQYSSRSVRGRTIEDFDRAIEKVALHLSRMERANAIVEKWGPLSAVPELLKLGLTEDKCAVLVTAGDDGRFGYSALDFQVASSGLRRLRSLREQLLGALDGGGPANGAEIRSE